MKKTQFIQKILSSLSIITFVSLSGNMAFAGIDLTYPGSELDLNQSLIPNGSFSNNTVTVSDGKIGHSVYGAKSDSEGATDNTVTISGGAINGNIYGGSSISGVVMGNTVMVSKGEVGRGVYGGWSDSGVVMGNTVTILGGSAGVNGVDVYGGLSNGGEATRNVVTISGGAINFVRGGSAPKAATGNTVTILGGRIKFNVQGGYSSEAARGNKVTISGGEIGQDATGGESPTLVINNTITVSDGNIKGKVAGGRSALGEVTGNTVTISGGVFGQGVTGGEGTAHRSSQVIKNNIVTISGGLMGGGGVVGGAVIRGASTGNGVIILGGEIGVSVYGGNTGAGVATGNTVIISGGKIAYWVYGGFSFASSYDGALLPSKALDNKVTISGGEIGRAVYGGVSHSGVAMGNTVTISGGKIGGDVYGGWVDWGTTATGNTVILDSGAGLSTSSSIYGGFCVQAGADGVDGADVISGNKLVLNDFQGTVKQIANFEFINITSSGKEGDMLTLVGGEATDLSQSKVSITFTGISRPFNMGDKINLIKNEAGITVSGGTLLQEGQKQVKSAVYIYDLLFDSDESTIHATVASKKFNDHSKALAEGRIASMAHLNMGADLIAGQGMAQAFDPDKLKGNIHLFSAMAATNSQYDTGSHVDLYGYSALVGVSVAPASLPSLNCGIFAESGWGNYGSFSEFEDGAVRGSGSTQYYGGGLLTHYDFTKMGIKGLTVEAFVRAGKTDADYQSGDLPNSKYDLSTPYYGVHVGGNYTRELSSKLKIANYARFLWSHLDGDNTTIEGSDLRFRTMDSQRIKAGSRLSYEIAPDITPYAGLSYEWECSGTARAVIDGGNGIAAPSLRGGTGTGELGAVWKPMAHQAFWVDFSAQGHVGTRQGVSGVVRLRAEF